MRVCGLGVEVLGKRIWHLPAGSIAGYVHVWRKFGLGIRVQVSGFRGWGLGNDEGS